MTRITFILPTEWLSIWVPESVQVALINIRLGYRYTHPAMEPRDRRRKWQVTGSGGDWIVMETDQGKGGRT
jgi:hypothetical protein